MRSRPEEAWAQRVIAHELQRIVEVHDDNSQPSMYDLRVGPVGAPSIAIECVGAVDPGFTATWNTIAAGDPWEVGVQGDWTVSIEVAATRRDLVSTLPRLLADLETRGLLAVRRDHALRRHDRQLFDTMEAAGVRSVSCHAPSGTGRVSFTMSGQGGAVDHTGASVPSWVSAFLRGPKRADVLHKLNLSSAPERHVFIPVSLVGAPSAVELYLAREIRQVPTSAPSLSSPVTHVWLASTIGAAGVRWDAAVWRRFQA